ncbi:Rad52/Rad22 family DNA repair protein [Senegalia massiliensis]|uniref:Uncharacterized protein n=1 Tax=Senegalia massiliensis TaxID=1720316 RepID=A0A845R272_9CLOT|nr:Rad52/Rad22 family DNA repair protein [Senegalia massiliensis]NBI07648.1 hypothetical protein [Senegalia massiliensis]
MEKITVANFREVQKKLQAEFDLEDIEFRIGARKQDNSKGIALVYVSNRAIQNRLDDIFSPFGWKNEFKEINGGKSKLCGISIKVYDHDDNSHWLTKWDGADNTEFSSTKGGLSDSMKRCAVQWGIGRYLYNMPKLWVEIKQTGKSYNIIDSELEELKKFVQGAPSKFDWLRKNSSTKSNSTKKKTDTSKKKNNNNSKKESRKTTKANKNVSNKNPNFNNSVLNKSQKGIISDLIKQVSENKRQPMDSVESLLLKELGVKSIDFIPKNSMTESMNILKKLITA